MAGGLRQWRSTEIELLQRVRALDLGPQHCCSAVEEVRYRGAFFPPVVPELGRQQRERQQAAVNLLVRDCPDRAKQLVVESVPAVDLPIRSPIQPRQQAGDSMPADTYTRSTRLKNLFLDAIANPRLDPRGPLAYVPEEVRNFVRQFVGHEAIFRTSEMRAREEETSPR